MKLLDYINDCLKDPEFRKYWGDEDFSFLDEKLKQTKSLPSKLTAVKIKDTKQDSLGLETVPTKNGKSAIES